MFTVWAQGCLLLTFSEDQVESSGVLLKIKTSYL